MKSTIMIFWKTCKFKVQIWQQTFLGRGILYKYTQKYIREQEKEDQIMDKLRTEEYINPFKGSK